MFGLEDELQDRIERLKKEKKLAYEKGRADAFRDALNMVRKIIRVQSKKKCRIG